MNYATSAPPWPPRNRNDELRGRSRSARRTDRLPPMWLGLAHRARPLFKLSAVSRPWRRDLRWRNLGKCPARSGRSRGRVAGNVEIRRAVGLTAKVARAVEYAHSRGILHRDLKPGNILLDGRGEPLVSDFGLAKWLDESSDLTRTLTIFGTPGYIAPEQAHGPASGLKGTADIYSIGAVLFDLFTGKTPFVGEHALAVIQQASEKPAPKLRSLAPA